MATLTWSSLTSGTYAFDPSTDQLVFDNGISAASVLFDSPDGTTAVFSFGGVTVTLQASPYTLTTTNVTFNNGSIFMVGDNNLAVPDSLGGGADNGPDTLTGGSGDDQLIGLGGADSLTGNGGNDLFPIVGDNLGIYGNDTINGGSGGQDRVYYGDSNGFGVTVNMGNETANGSANGGDGSPGSTLTYIGIEAVTGTSNADTFNANSLTQVNGLRGDINQRFEGRDGNDTVNGATGNGRNTVLEYRESPGGVTVNLGAGTASDGWGGTDSFNNVDAVIGSFNNDVLTGGSQSTGVNGGFIERFEGLGGNDTIDGQFGNDRVEYDNSPAGVYISLANGSGTASDGWGGSTDVLLNIEQVRGSEFNDTMLGGDNGQSFEGQGGNDFIDGGTGDDDEVRYQRSTEAVYVNLGLNLGRGLADSVSGGTVGIDTISNIEEVGGSDFNDSLVGGGLGGGDESVKFEAFEGLAGNDTLVGNGNPAFIEAAAYTRSPSGVIANLSGSTVLGVATNTANDGFGVNGKPAGIDTLVNINALEGSSFNDTLVGGNGDDHFAGRNGNDSIVGGAGTDWVHYGDSPSRTGGSNNGVVVNLDTANSLTIGSETVVAGTTLDGWTTNSTDTLSGIENVEGSDFNDFFHGSDAANFLIGADGNDTLLGGFQTTDTANDTLMGEGGDDVIRQSKGADYMDGGDGTNDMLVFNNPQGTNTSTGLTYATGVRGVNVNLGTGTSDYDTSDGANPVGTVVNIEQVWGTAGDDVLTGGSLVRTGSGNFVEVYRGGPGNDTFDGQGGGAGGSAFFDRVEYGSISSADTLSGGVTVNLATGTATDGRGGTDTLINIDWVVGTSFADSMVGGNPLTDDFERFEGLAGNDTIDGGSGIDQASYQNSAAGVVVNLASNTASDGFGGTDTLLNIEQVRGSNSADTLLGGGNDELFIGESGADVINGGGGIDFVSWQTRSLDNGGVNFLLDSGSGIFADGFGIDTVSNIEGLAGSNSNDTLTGGVGDQWFRGRGGSDYIDGGEGVNTADYSTDPLGVVVNLANQTATDGWGGIYGMQGTDTLLNIQNVVGSSFADSITGTSGANRFDGGAGNDTLTGQGGNDTLTGGADIDTASYANAAAGINLNLLSGFASADGDGGSDSLSGVENIVGSGFNDTITGSQGANLLQGLGGNDLVDGGEGADTIDGGSGSDTVSFASLALGTGATVNLGTNTASDGNGGSLTLISIENAAGSGLNDSLAGDGNANVLDGAAGADTLDGAAGNDTLIGGADNDTYVLGAGDVLIETAGQGTDTVLTGSTYTLLTDFENLTLTGTIAINGTGNAVANVLTGNSGNNALDGAGGDDTLDGGAGADTLTGGANNDTYILGTGDVLVETAGQGTDTVLTGATYTLLTDFENLTLTGTLGVNATGNAANNVLTGNSGINQLDGGAGVDTMAGGAGNDTYVVDAVGEVVTENLNEGTDLVQSGVSYTLGANVENLTLTGTLGINATGNSLNNALTGNSGINQLNGGAGDDTMTGGAGNDTYVVDSTLDVVQENASAGTDLVQASISYTLLGNVENLTLTGTININATGNALNNVVTGNSGDNTLNGSTGADTMIGGAGNDTYIVDNAGDLAQENSAAGTDTVQSGVTYTLAGNVENLTLTGTLGINATGNAANNVLTGNSGINQLNGGVGNDTMAGGAGNDTYIVDAVGDVVQENASEGTDLVQSAATYTLGANVENLTLTGTLGVNATGNTLNNTLTGNSGINNLNGGAGNDTMFGGLGNDTYVVDSALDVVAENASAGTDLVQASISYTLLGNVESLTLTGTINLNGTGNALANTVTGNSGNNILDGGAGADTLIGGAGNDTYIVDNSADVVAENAAAGTDLVQASASYTLVGNIENLTLTGTLGIAGTGNAQDNVVTGNSGANVLSGGIGNDTLDGGAGNDSMFGGTGSDTYIVDAAGDVVAENANEGFDTVQTSSSYALLGNVENLTLTGTGNTNGTGNALSNVITGNSGDNVLDGGVGVDTLVGGAGNDTYVVDALGDVVTEGASAGTDTVQTTVSGYTLAANVENLTLTGSGNLNGTGSGVDNVVTGNSGNNLLNGAGGNDTLVGGAGDDTLVYDAADGRVDGGAETLVDVLRIDGSGVVLNLAGLSGTTLLNIEAINLTGAGANTLTLTAADLLALSSSSDTLRVDGNGGDVVNAGSGWVTGGDQVIGLNTYHSYTQGLATLLVDTDITQNVLP